MTILYANHLNYRYDPRRFSASTDSAIPVTSNIGESTSSETGGGIDSILYGNEVYQENQWTGGNHAGWFYVGPEYSLSDGWYHFKWSTNAGAGIDWLSQADGTQASFITLLDENDKQIFSIEPTPEGRVRTYIGNLDSSGLNSVDFSGNPYPTINTATYFDSDVAATYDLNWSIGASGHFALYINNQKWYEYTGDTRNNATAGSGTTVKRIIRSLDKNQDSATAWNAEHIVGDDTSRTIGMRLKELDLNQGSLFEAQLVNPQGTLVLEGIKTPESQIDSDYYFVDSDQDTLRLNPDVNGSGYSPSAGGDSVIKAVVLHHRSFFIQDSADSSGTLDLLNVGVRAYDSDNIINSYSLVKNEPVSRQTILSTNPIRNYVLWKDSDINNLEFVLRFDSTV